MPFKAKWENTTPADPSTVTIAPSVGDFLLACYVNDSNTANDFTPPAGWTELCELKNNTDNQGFVVWSRVADGTETSISFDANSGNVGISFVLSFDGVSQTVPLDVTPVTFNNNTSDTTSDLSITPVSNGCDIVLLFGNDRGSSGDTSFTFSTQSGTTGAWTNRADITSGFMNAAAGVTSQSVAGAITARCTTDVAGGRSGIIIALRPAASIEQEGFRFGADDGAEDAHTWIDSQDVSVTQPAAQNLILSVLVNATNAPGATTFKLQHRKVGDTNWIDTPLQ